MGDNMKNKKILAIIALIIGISLIGVGLLINFDSDEPTPSNPPSSGQESGEEYNPEKDYKIIYKTEDNTVEEIPEDNFSETSSKIGFSEKSTCADGMCTADKKKYNDIDNEDSFIIMYVDGKAYSYGTIMYYKESDYKLDIVVANLNSVIKNYVGYNYTVDYISDLNSKLNIVLQNDDLDDDVVIDRVYVGEYTLETIISLDSNIYMVKTFLIRTSDYM